MREWEVQLQKLASRHTVRSMDVEQVSASKASSRLRLGQHPFAASWAAFLVYHSFSKCATIPRIFPQIISFYAMRRGGRPY